MSSLPSNELLDPIFEKEGLIEGFKVIWFVINNFFIFEISGGSNTLSQKNYKGDWALDNVCPQFRDFTKMSSFPWSFDNL